MSGSVVLCSRRIAPLVAVATLALIGISGTGVASAEATKVPFEDTETIYDDQGTLPECWSDAVGRLTGTAHTVGYVLDTGTTTHVEFTVSENYRLDFSDGTYIVGDLMQHTSVNFVGIGLPFESTTTTPEQRTIYDADGNPIGTVRLRFEGHITVFDTNGDGHFEPDEIVTNPIHLTVICQ